MFSCTTCGTPNPAAARYCSNCGIRLAEPGSVEAEGGYGVPDAVEPSETATFGVPSRAEPLERRLGPDHAAVVEALPPGHGLLVAQRGPGAGSRFLLDSDRLTVGRQSESDILLDDVTVSRRHAEFERRGTTFSVRDVGSLNGTYVNRDRVDEATLHNGDEVQIGKYRMLFFAAPGGGSH
jgi:hypothetical protein